MTLQIRRSRAAREDLLDIWRYIAQCDQRAADQQLDRIIEDVERLREFPNIGHVRDDARAGVRVLLKDRYLIIYCHHERDALIQILRIVHGSRDLASVFE